MQLLHVFYCYHIGYGPVYYLSHAVIVILSVSVCTLSFSALAGSLHHIHTVRGTGKDKYDKNDRWIESVSPPSHCKVYIEVCLHISSLHPRKGVFHKY